MYAGIHAATLHELEAYIGTRYVPAGERLQVVRYLERDETVKGESGVYQTLSLADLVT